MRMVGTCGRGIRIPIISRGDDLGEIVVESVLAAADSEGFQIRNRDVIGITEAVVAKAEGNYASYSDIEEDIKEKFPEGEVGLVFPILSRNRFLNILKGISKGTDKLYVLMSYPQDEVGNPIMDTDVVDPDSIENRLYSEKEFRELNKDFLHPFTGMDYISLYKNAGDNIEIYFSKNPLDILKLTDNVLVGGIHNRFRLRDRLIKEGAKKVHLLSDVLSTKKEGRGHNEKYGVLGSNIATESTIKLFPNCGDELVKYVQEGIKQKTGKNVEVLVYGDGAFKDPMYGIWELADPVVSPAYTDGLSGKPNEIKLKYIADNKFGHLDNEEKQEAVREFIKTSTKEEIDIKEGTTPRKYADLLGSLCDLLSGSGDKGTPVIHIQGYFDNYTDV